MVRYAICNELFEGWPWPKTLDLLSQLGYRGVELAPFTLAPSPAEFTASQRSALRRQIEASGLAVVGLHWLLAKTTSLHLTSTDSEIRNATTARLGELAVLCRDLGGSLMVLGSPQQRNLPPGVTPERGLELAAETLRPCFSWLEACQVDLCLEPLGPGETNFLNTLAEADELRRRLDHPRVKLHLDVKAMSSERLPIPELIRAYAGRAGHFHANDPNRRGPGFGATDFRPIFAALAEAGYQGWVSVEVFDYSPDPETIARESLNFMRRSWPVETR